jgi:hypothetical protein
MGYLGIPGAIPIVDVIDHEAIICLGRDILGFRDAIIGGELIAIELTKIGYKIYASTTASPKLIEAIESNDWVSIVVEIIDRPKFTDKEYFENLTKSRRARVWFDAVTFPCEIVASFHRDLKKDIVDRSRYHIIENIIQAYDDLDEIDFAFVFLPMLGRSIVVGQYINNQPASLDIYAALDIENIDTLIDEACDVLSISRGFMYWKKLEEKTHE